MDPWTYIGFITSSFVANLVVLGITSASLIVLGGTFYLLVNFDVAKKFVLNGLVLSMLMGLLSLAQIGAVPTSFGQVGELGLLALPPWTTGILDVATGAMHFLVTWASNVMIPLGVILTIGRVNWGPKMVIIGAVMSTLAAIVSGQGLVALAFLAIKAITGYP